MPSASVISLSLYFFIFLLYYLQLTLHILWIVNYLENVGATSLAAVFVVCWRDFGFCLQRPRGGHMRASDRFHLSFSLYTSVCLCLSLSLPTRTHSHSTQINKHVCFRPPTHTGFKSSGSSQNLSAVLKRFPPASGIEESILNKKYNFSLSHLSSVYQNSVWKNKPCPINF